MVFRKLWDPSGLLDHEFRSVEDWWLGEDEEKKEEDTDVGENLSLEDGDE